VRHPHVREPDPDEIRQTLESIRSAVRTEAGYLTEDQIPSGPRSSAVRDAADLATVSAHLPVQSTLPVIGPAIVLAQRVIRLGLRWYINPIVEQQNAFNDSIVRALTEIEIRQADLERRLEGAQAVSTLEADE
jgi:hypothetical protein